MDDFDSLEPSAADLAEIELEERLITAEIVMLTAEIGLLAAAERGGPTALDWKRLRVANRRVIRAGLELVVPPHVCRETRLVETAMSDCRYGCKAMTCTDCGWSHVWHNATYGCRQTAVGLVPGGLTRPCGPCSTTQPHLAPPEAVSSPR